MRTHGGDEKRITISVGKCDGKEPCGNWVGNRMILKCDGKEPWGN
jgi:hypothetical protein